MCTLSVSNVIYHKFLHGAAFYTLNGKNVNVMLEYGIAPWRLHKQQVACSSPGSVIFFYLQTLHFDAYSSPV